MKTPFTVICHECSRAIEPTEKRKTVESHIGTMPGGSIRTRFDFCCAKCSNGLAPAKNARKGHGMGGLALLPVFIVLILAGWPVVMPTMGLLDANTPENTRLFFAGIAAIPGTWIHYRLWCAVCWGALRVWKWLAGGGDEKAKRRI